MDTQTALLDVRRMGEADRLTVATGTPATELVVDAIFGAGLAWTLALPTVAARSRC